MREKLEAIEMCFYEKFTNIVCTEQVSTKDVFMKMAGEKTLIVRIRKRELKFFEKLKAGFENITFTRHTEDKTADELV